MAKHIGLSEIIEVWEHGDGLSAPERALLALGPAFPEKTLGELKSLSIGARNAALIAAREAVSGPVLTCLVNCEQCGASLEFQETTTALVEGYEPPEADRFTVEDDGVAVEVRLLNSHDLIAAAEEMEIDAAWGRLLARAVVSAKGPDGAPVDSLSAEMIARMSEAMAERDPLSRPGVALRCDECSHVWTADLDIMAFLWGEIVRGARDGLEDVRRIARRFGWGEAEILSMSPARRAYYLEDAE